MAVSGKAMGQFRTSGKVPGMTAASSPVSHSIARVAFVVHEYDEAIAFFTGALGFALLEDRALGDAKRWVVVGPASGRGAELVLARATTAAQRAQVGQAAGGRVAFFLETDDFARDHHRLQLAGVCFTEAPRHEAYGTVAVFLDLYGNPWDLLQPAAAPNANAPVAAG
jgi:catechol 2,3-dioxygenase-like lactoylglutathione lyase family enzyme